MAHFGPVPGLQLALENVRYFRFSLVQAAAGGFIQGEINTNLNISRESTVVAMLHGIEYEVDIVLDQPGASGTETSMIQVCKATQTAEIFLNDPDLLIKHSLIKDRGAAIGTDAGPAIFMYESPIRVVLQSFVAVAAERLFVSYDSTQANVATVRGRIPYHLITLSEKEFLRLSAGLIN